MVFCKEAQGRGRVDVFEALRGGLGFESDRVFLAERDIGRGHRRRDIGHARAALALGHPAHGVEAGAGDRGDRAPAGRVAGVLALHARQRVSQRRDDGIEVLRRGLEVVVGQAGRNRHALGERLFHQPEGFLRSCGNAHVWGPGGVGRAKGIGASGGSARRWGWRCELKRRVRAKNRRCKGSGGVTPGLQEIEHRCRRRPGAASIGALASRLVGCEGIGGRCRRRQERPACNLSSLSAAGELFVRSRGGGRQSLVMPYCGFDSRDFCRGVQRPIENQLESEIADP